jgi:hypothetical protein
MLFSFDNKVLSYNILADCHMRRHREWGAHGGCGTMAAAMVGGCVVFVFIYAHCVSGVCRPKNLAIAESRVLLT